ncbi:hypothetical protein [Nocardiopsis valliformis]|uniref:hypothetical protein n=1 Tax=Nocardiopsis valliformis TaxID=239974 RepID=UPI000346DF61|nr:hypothetical protein [Nocardiopsis valliformis]
MPRPDHGDEFEEEEEERAGAEESKDKKKRIDLSMAQVAGAGVATLTAATAASYLNVYGTVIGTGVMAVLSTSAAPVIQHWLTRSGEQAKELAEKKAARQKGVRALVDTEAEAAAEAATQDAAEAGTGHMGFDTGATRVADPDAPNPFGFPADPDATRTMAMPMVGLDLPGQTVAHGFGNPEDPTQVGGPPVADATEPLPQIGGPGDTRYPDGPARDNEDADGAIGDERPKRGWKTAVISAAAVFTLVMLVILAFELLTGRSLTAWTQGQDEPTSPSLFGGQSSQVQDEEEAPETTEGDQPETENGTGTQPQGTDAPVEPEPIAPPGEPQPEVPGGGATDPAEPPVNGGEPAEPGGGEAPDPGAENPPEGDTPAEPAPVVPNG